MLENIKNVKNVQNQTYYMAALVADGWAGAEKRTLLRTNRPTDGPADRKVAYRVACPRLKITKDLFGYERREREKVDKH